MTTYPFKIIDPLKIQAAARGGSDRYPYAAWMPIPENATQLPIVPWSLILHTEAGPRLTTLEALWAYVNRNDINGEPTFILDMDGRMAQVVECDVRADNNAKANSWIVGGQRRGAVSVETQDFGYPTLPHTPWTDLQVEQLAGLAAFLHIRYGIDLDRCSTWDDRGVDGHRRFPEWSIYVGKTCPGQVRYTQIDGIISLATHIAYYNQGEEPMPAQVKLITYANGKTYPAGHWAAGSAVETTVFADGAFLSHVWDGMIKDDYKYDGVPEQKWLRDRLLSKINSGETLNASPFGPVAPNGESPNHAADSELDAAWQLRNRS